MNGLKQNNQDEHDPLKSFGWYFQQNIHRDRMFCYEYETKVMEMTQRQLMKKLDNIWYHYKTHILIGALVLALMIPFFFFSNDRKPSALNVTIIGNSIDLEQQRTLQKEASPHILKETSQSEIKFSFWEINGEISSPANIDLHQKLLAQITAKNIDILLIDKSDFLILFQQGAFLQLDSIKDSGNNKNYNMYGIDITGNKILRTAGYDTENKMMAILSNTQNKETAMKFVQWVASKNP
ncbi:hypothetical protein COC96_00840 [Bacillus cereus]|nr:hypothetical protein COC96_00840 [Bacillus cereus]